MKSIYTVKNIKILDHDRGTHYTATIYRDGKKIGTVEEEGRGGCSDFEYNSEADEKAMKDYCVDVLGMDKEYPENDSLFIETLVFDADLNKILKRRCKKKTLFSLKSKGDGEFFSLNMVFTEQIRKALIEKHGDDIGEFANDRFLTKEPYVITVDFIRKQVNKDLNG